MPVNKRFFSDLLTNRQLSLRQLAKRLERARPVLFTKH